MLIQKQIVRLAILLTILLVNQSAIAQVTSWTAGGGANNKFTDPVNWSSGTPGPGDQANFSLPITQDVFVNDESTANFVRISDGDFTFFGGNPLTVNANFITTSDAVAEWTETDTELFVFGLVVVEDESAFVIRDGGYLEAKNQTENAGVSVQNNAKLIISNSPVKADQIRSGFGTPAVGSSIAVEEGSIVSTLSAQIGRISTSDSELNVRDSGTEWFSDEFSIGVFGVGQANIQSGAEIEAIQTFVGTLGNSSGRINVTGNGSLWNTNQLILGDGGDGTLRLSNGGDFQAANIVVGDDASGSGAIEIVGAGATLTVSNSLTIGNNGVGSYSQTGGTATVGGQTTVGPGSTFTISSTTFTSGGLLNDGTMEFTTGFANLQTDVAVRVGANLQVTTPNPVNFLQNLQHNGTELFIEEDERVNVFGDYTGFGAITGTGVIHFRGNIDPGANANTLLFGRIESDVDMVFENTSSYNIRLDGADLEGGDAILGTGSMDLQSPSLNVVVSDANQIQDGDEFVILECSDLTGGFQGLAEGDVVAQVGAINFVISYTGGSGNDVALTADIQTGSFELAANSFSTFRGIQVGGNLSSIQSGDDIRLRYNPGFTLNGGEAPVWIIFDATLPTDSPSDLKLFYEANANTPGLTLTVEAFNWNTNSFNVLDSFDASFNTDENVGIIISGQDQFVEDGTGNVRARIGWRKTGFTILFPWEIGIDWMGWSGG